MALTKEQIIDAIAELSVKDVVELISAMEERFGVSAASAVAVAAGPAEVVEEKTEFNVVLTGVGANKVGVIKVVRAATEATLSPPGHPSVNTDHPGCRAAIISLVSPSYCP